MTDTFDPQEPSQQDVPEEKKKKRKKGNPWVENVEALATAVILALIIRTFVVEAFVIPTGSMASTLYGDHLEFTCSNCGMKHARGYRPGREVSRVSCPNCGEDVSLSQQMSVAGGDRILVNKVLYRFTKPRRWDPFVFVNPNVKATDNGPKTTYIKRLVGLPGDKLEILRGDLIINGEIARKPESAQSSLWMFVYDMNYPWKHGNPFQADELQWKLEGKRLLVDCPKDRLSWLQYAGRQDYPFGEIRDFYSYGQLAHAGSGVGAGENVVTDIKVSFDIEGQVTGKLIIKLERNLKDDEAILDFKSGKASIRRSGIEVASTELPDMGLTNPSGGRKHSVTFYRLDYMLRLLIDGKVVLEKDVWNQAEYERTTKMRIVSGYRNSGVKLGGWGIKCEISNLKIDRDVYYAPTKDVQGEPTYYSCWTLDDDSYFAMGDNSPESHDSRVWDDGPSVPSDHLIGKSLLIWWHPKRIRLIH